MSPFPIFGVSSIFFILLLKFLYANSVDPDQALLIWVYTVCQDPKTGKLGIKGLTGGLRPITSPPPRSGPNIIL